MNKKAQELAVYGLVTVLLIIITLAFYWYFVVIPYISSSVIKQSIVAKEKVDVIVSFLAILELSKQRLISLEQKGLFGEINIRRTANPRAADSVQ